MKNYIYAKGSNQTSNSPFQNVEAKKIKIMMFSGFNVSPVGNAVLTVNNGILTVSGISSSGLDGVSIDVTGNNNCSVNFAPLTNIKANNGVLKCSLLSKNAFGQVTPSWELFKWYNSGSDKIITGYNTAFLPSSYDTFGRLNGLPVFDINNGSIPNSPDPDFPPPAAIGILVWGLIVAVAAVAAQVYDTLSTKTTTSSTKNYDANGKFTGCSHTVSTDPVPFNIEVDGTIYTVDEYGLKFDTIVPTNLIGLPSIETFPLAVIITGTDLSSFEITSIV